MSIVLPPEFEDFVNRQVATGAFGNQQEVLQTALGLLQRREKLLAQIDEGSNDLRAGRSAEYSESDRDRFMDDIRARSEQNRTG